MFSVLDLLFEYDVYVCLPSIKTRVSRKSNSSCNIIIISRLHRENGVIVRLVGFLFLCYKE